MQYLRTARIRSERSVQEFNQTNEWRFRPRFWTAGPGTIWPSKQVHLDINLLQLPEYVWYCLSLSIGDKTLTYDRKHAMRKCHIYLVYRNEWCFRPMPRFCTCEGYNGPGKTWTNEMNFAMNHAPGALIDHSACWPAIHRATSVPRTPPVHAKDDNKW